MKKSKNDYTGKFWASGSPEWYDHGPFDTKEEAIAEYKAEHDGHEPPHIGVSRAVYAELDGDLAIEQWANGQGSELYEDAMDNWCNKIPREHMDELSNKLTEVFHEWLDKMGEDKCWNVIEEIDQ